MGTVKIITPVHIGSGNSYYVVQVKDNYVYSLESLYQIMDPKLLKNPYLLKGVQKKKNLTREEFVSLFKYDVTKLNPSISIGKISNHKPTEFIGNVFEMTKENNKLYIPGSTIKGYINNILWFDIVQNNKTIREYMESKYQKIFNDNIDEAKYMNNFKRYQNRVNKDVARVITKLEEEVTYIMNVIGVRDIYFDDKIDYYDVYRYDIKDNSIPQGIFETIPIDSISTGEHIFSIVDDASEYVEKLKQEICRKIENIVRNDRKTSDFEKNTLINVKKELLNAICSRLKNFSNWFEKANRTFIDKILDREIKYAEELYNSKVDTVYLKNKLKELKQLNQEKSILQIGHSTNYMVKTFGIAFTDTYEKFFEVVFSPSAMSEKTIKRTPGISMMPLAKIREKGVYPLGFIEIEL